MTAASLPKPKPQARGGSFAAALANLLEVPQRVQGDDEVRKLLKAELEGLPKPWQDKIGALLNLGRQARGRSPALSRTAQGHDATPLDALALCDERTRSHQYLERSLAMMCSERLDLDKGEAPAEGGVRTASVYERAWSRFGRELAGSETEEWSWFAQRTGRTHVLAKVYLRRGDSAWWSFGVNLDRPRQAQVGTQLATAAKRRDANQGSGLASLARAPCTDRRALQRAMRSVRARLGILSGDAAAARGAQ